MPITMLKCRTRVIRSLFAKDFDICYYVDSRQYLFKNTKRSLAAELKAKDSNLEWFRILSKVTVPELKAPSKEGTIQVAVGLAKGTLLIPSDFHSPFSMQGLHRHITSFAETSVSSHRKDNEAISIASSL